MTWHAYSSKAEVTSPPLVLPRYEVFHNAERKYDGPIERAKKFDTVFGKIVVFRDKLGQVHFVL